MVFIATTVRYLQMSNYKERSVDVDIWIRRHGLPGDVDRAGAHPANTALATFALQDYPAVAVASVKERVLVLALEG